MENTTRQSNNKAFVTGILKEKNINFKTNDEGKEMASGYLLLITNTPSGKGEVKVSVSQNRFTKDGKENSLYKGLVTIQKEYLGTKETGSEETADVVKVTGELRDGAYYSVKKGDFVEKLDVKGTFIERVDKTKKPEHGVKIILEGCIVDIKAVEEELEVKMISIGYGGVAIPVVARVEKDLVIPFQQIYQVGSTAQLNFAIINVVEIEDYQKDMAFGESIGEKIERTISKTIIFGGDAVNYQNPYSEEQIKQALALREVKLQEKKEYAEKKESNGGVQMNQGFGLPNGTSMSNNGFGNGMPMGVGFGAPAGIGSFGMSTGSFGS